MKYKVNMPENYKKYFTLDDMQRVKEIKNDPDLQETIQTMVDIYSGCWEVLKVECEFCKYDGSTFWGPGSNVDIAIKLYVICGISFLIKYAAISEINEITDFNYNVGYIETYRRIH